MRQPVWIVNLSQNTSFDNTCLLGLIATQEDYWHCTTVDPIIVNNEDKCKQLMGFLSQEGETCKKIFLDKKYPINNFQVCVIGDSNEDTTLSCFSIIATLLRTIFVSKHTETGIEITGLLFIPHFISTNIEKKKLDDYAQFLKELKLTADYPNEAYNRIVLYQDIQNQDSSAYPKLDRNGLTELLFQYLLSIYFVDATKPSVFGYVASNRSYFYTMGASSVFYDSRIHKKELIDFVSAKLFEVLKSEEHFSKQEAINFVEHFIRENSFNAKTTINAINGVLPNISDSEKLKKMIGNPNPHPVWDLFKSSLIPEYFLDYLKFFPARLKKYFQEHVNLLVTNVSFIFGGNRMKQQESIQALFKHCIALNIKNGVAEYYTYAQIISYYERWKEKIEQMKRDISETSLSVDILPVPDFLKHYYSESESENSRDNINRIVEKLKEELRTEPTVLSLLTRSFFLGTVLVFIVMPVFKSLPVYVIPLLFFAPLVWSLLFKLRRHFKFIKKQVNRAIAESIWQSQQILQKRLISETSRYLDGLLAFCKAEVKKLQEERESVMYHAMEQVKLPIPQTTFNQPLMNGMFSGEPIVKNKSKLESNIMIGQKAKTLFDIDLKDYIDILAVLAKERKEPNDLQNSLLKPQEHFDDEEKYALVSAKISAIFKHYFEKKIITVFSDTICEFVNRCKDDDVFDFEKMIAMANINGKLHDSYVVQDLFVRTKGSFESLNRFGYKNTDDDNCLSHIFLIRLCRMNTLSTRFILGEYHSPLNQPSFAYYLLAGAIRKSGGTVDKEQLDENKVNSATELLNLYL